MNHLVDYNLFNIDDLEIDQMVKISLTYFNAYRWSIHHFIGPMTEHIWCKILRKLPNNNLLVLISNNSYFSESIDIPPLKYEDQIIINTSKIKEYKVVNAEIYQQQSQKLLDNLPASVKLIMVSLPKENAIKFLEAYLINKEPI